jgi:hypothetical protein
MSSKKVQQFFRRLTVVSSTFLAGITTITVAETHYLVTSDLITIFFANVPQVLNQVPITYVGANSFSVVTPIDYIIDNKAEIIVGYYSTGVIGGQVPLMLTHQTGNTAVVQTWISGTGGSTCTLEGSLDGIHFTPAIISTITNTGSNGNTQAGTIEPAWAYVRVNVGGVGASSKLYVNISG